MEPNWLAGSQAGGSPQTDMRGTVQEEQKQENRSESLSTQLCPKILRMPQTSPARLFPA